MSSSLGPGFFIFFQEDVATPGTYDFLEPKIRKKVEKEVVEVITGIVERVKEPEDAEIALRLHLDVKRIKYQVEYLNIVIDELKRKKRLRKIKVLLMGTAQ